MVLEAGGEAARPRPLLLAPCLRSSGVDSAAYAYASNPDDGDEVEAVPRVAAPA